MLTPFPPKTSAMMRREAEQRSERKRKSKPPGRVDPSRRQLLDGASWSAFLRTGSVDGSNC